MFSSKLFPKLQSLRFKNNPIELTPLKRQPSFRYATSYTNLPGLSKEDLLNSLPKFESKPPNVLMNSPLKKDYLHANMKKEDSQVMRYMPADTLSIDKDTPEIMVICKNNVVLKYAKQGVLPNLVQKNPEDILSNEISLSKGINIVSISCTTPFQICGKNYDIRYLHKCDEYGKFERVLSADESLMAIEINKITDLTNKKAELLSAYFQEYIFSHEKLAKFGNEDIAPIQGNSCYINQSATLMRFMDMQSKNKKSTNSDCHYHMGSRHLLVFTTGKYAAIELFTSGINEDIDEKSPKKRIEFPKNSISSLYFPTSTHHKFDGSFTAISYHQFDSPFTTNLLKEIRQVTCKSSPLPFLSFNTVDSRFKN